ncbi:hypothetical protein BHM03_00000201 [Ensete ventricosum]|nr:hypothetical protein BHM03_00000201 [Ensete ventricosum]
MTITDNHLEINNSEQESSRTKSLPTTHGKGGYRQRWLLEETAVGLHPWFCVFVSLTSRRSQSKVLVESQQKTERDNCLTL